VFGPHFDTLGGELMPRTVLWITLCLALIALGPAW